MLFLFLCFTYERMVAFSTKNAGRMGINVFRTCMLGLRHISLISLKFMLSSSADLAHLIIPL